MKMIGAIPAHVAIARICHEANRAYCLAIGDASQKSWDEAPEWQRESAESGALAHLRNPNMKPEDSHNEWLKEKREHGWKYGPVKDADLKEHPCFVSFDELPQEQQQKDILFAAICDAFRDSAD